MIDIKVLKIGDSIITFDFKNKVVEFKLSSWDVDREPIYINEDYKEWDYIYSLYKKADNGSISAKEELNKELLNLVREI